MTADPAPLVGAAGPVLAGFDPGPEIRRSVRGHARHVPRLRAASRDLARFARMEKPRRDEALGSRLAAVRQALWRSPFWCARLETLGVSPGDLRSLDDLAHFPTLDREALAGGFDELPALPPARGRGRLFVERSSGSTGRPLAVLKEDYDSVHMWAVLRFWLRRLGLRLPPRPRVALLCTLPHGVEYEAPLPALGGGSLVRISTARPEPATRLRRFRPHVLFSDPAGLHWLAGQGERPRPRLALSSALCLAPSLRRRARERLGAPVVNYYSTAETGPIAWECFETDGLFHALVPDVWVEAVGGALAVTRLRPSVLPLVRYLTGDRGEVRDECCACGHRGPSIHGLDGRRACAFVTPDGREVDAWRLGWVFQHHPLDAFRLTQERPDAFRLETSDDSGGAAGADLLPRLRGSLLSLGWTDPRVEWRRVPSGRLAAAKPLPFVRAGRRPEWEDR